MRVALSMGNTFFDQRGKLSLPMHHHYIIQRPCILPTIFFFKTAKIMMASARLMNSFITRSCSGSDLQFLLVLLGR